MLDLSSILFKYFCSTSAIRIFLDNIMVNQPTTVVPYHRSYHWYGIAAELEAVAYLGKVIGPWPHFGKKIVSAKGKIGKHGLGPSV